MIATNHVKAVRKLCLNNGLSSCSGLSQGGSLGGSRQLGDSRRQCLIPNLGRRERVHDSLSLV